jgi:hypothetical protein
MLYESPHNHLAIWPSWPLEHFGGFGSSCTYLQVSLKSRIRAKTLIHLFRTFLGVNIIPTKLLLELSLVSFCPFQQREREREREREGEKIL